MDPIAKRRPLAGLKITSEDDPLHRKSAPPLRDSISRTGINNVPVFHTADGTVVDGNTRVAVMRDLGLTECVAIELPAEWKEPDILRFSIATDGIRRVFPPEELASKAERFMELTDSTQEEAARELGISAAHLSRAFTSLLLPERYREKCKPVVASIKAIIASERDSAIQEKLVAFATTPVNGKIPSRDQVVLYRKRLHKTLKDQPGPKPKQFTVKYGGHEAVIKPKSGTTTEDIAKWLEALASKLKANKHLPPDGLRFLFP